MCGLDQFEKNNFDQWYIVHQEHMKDDFFDVLQNDTNAQLLAIEVFSESTAHAKGTSDYTSHDILDEKLFGGLLAFFEPEYQLFNYTLPTSIHDNPNKPIVHYSTLKKKINFSLFYKNIMTDNRITLTVKTQDGYETVFRMGLKVPLRKMITAYCSTKGISTDSVRFLYDGDPISPEDTPESLEMEEGDSLDALLQQTGGS